MIKSFSDNKYYRASFLQEIFKQDSRGDTTVKSLYYQHIIKFFLKDMYSYYKVREVINWIIDIVPLRTKDAQKGHNLISNNKSDTVEDREKTFRKYCRHLFSWGILLERQTNAEKGQRIHF